MAAAIPFLTDLDSRAAIKGSRDPLGVQPIWARMGRRVIGNLTTVTTSVRDFTVTMLGYYLSELVAEENGDSSDLHVFLRWEQLAAYARGGRNNAWGFRGTERAKRYWSESDHIRLGTDPSALIMSDQKTYGLWGLYTVAARSSALIEGSPSRLTHDARRFIEANYWPILGDNSLNHGRGLVELLGKSSIELKPNGRDSSVFEAVAKVLRNKLSTAERNFYSYHLAKGGPQDSTQGKQGTLADAMKGTLALPDWRLSSRSVDHLAKACRNNRSEVGRGLAESLDSIRAVESLLAPSISLFSLLQSSDSQKLADVAGRIQKQWGPAVRSIDPSTLKAVESDLLDASGEPASAKRWLLLAESLATGDYESSVAHTLEQNRAVMATRGNAAPWIEIRDRKLHVRLAAESEANLPSKAELPEHWVNPYFLDSLRGIAAQLEP